MFRANFGGGIDYLGCWFRVSLTISHSLACSVFVLLSHAICLCSLSSFCIPLICTNGVFDFIKDPVVHMNCLV